MKGQKIFISKSLRGEMLKKVHEGHLGIAKTLMKAEEVFFWTGMSMEVTEKIKKVAVCLENPPSQKTKPSQVT